MKRRNAALDGLRGIAIVMVLFFHTDALFGGEFSGGGGKIVSLLMGAGWTGVDLFFVLSGFLITGLLFEAKGNTRAPDYFSGFYVRRALRILPLYYGFLALFFALPRCALFDNNHYRLTSGDTWSLALFYYNLHCIWSAHVVPNLHMFWSLSIEEHFYLLWPLVVWKFSEKWVMRLCAVLIALSLGSRIFVLMHGYPLQAAYLLTICRFDGLAIGAFLATAKRSEPDWQRVEGAALPVLALAAVVGAAIWAWQGHFKDVLDFRFPHDPVRHDSKLSLSLGITATSFMFGAAVVFALRSGGRFALLLGWKPLASIGRYSYGMYVFHRLLLRASDFAGRNWVPGYGNLYPAVAKPVFALWLIALSYAVAWASFRFYEARFQALGRAIRKSPSREAVS